MARISEMVRYMTIRILTSTDGTRNWSGSGTGFLYVFRDGDRQVPVLVTNKHVLDGALCVGLNFHSASADDTPLPGAGRMIAFQTHQVPILRHPDQSVDLAAIAILPLMEYAINNEGWRPYVKCLDKSNLPSQGMLSDLGALEDIVMVGYPTGIIDAVNNFPIARRGITSTPYNTDYQGRREFLADIPVYGGSSGSPIFLINEGSWSTADGLAMGTRFLLVGVLYAGHTETMDGHIVANQIPTSLNPVAKVTHMINLGLCIKSALIEDIGAAIMH